MAGFQQKEAKEEFWIEDPPALTELFVRDVQWYEQHVRKVSKTFTMLLRHGNDQELRNLRRNRIQGDIVLTDFLQTDVMKRNFPKLCPASLWALAHCMDKQRFPPPTANGTNNLRGDANFLLEFNRYLEDAKYGSICHGTHLYNDQSILRNGLDVDYGVRAGLSARNMIHFCVATNQRPLKHHGLYCYLDLKVAIGEMKLKVMYSKTAQVVLVESRVPPQALCLTRKSPAELGCSCLPRQEDLIKPRGRDADQVPIKKVGEIFKASPLLRPGPATSSLATIAEVEQPIVIEDDDDAKMTGDSAGSADASQKAPPPVPVKRRPMLKSLPSTRPKAVLKSAPSTLTRAPPLVERYVVPKRPAVVPIFDISDFPMTLPGLPSSIASSPATTWHRRLRGPQLIDCHQRQLLRSQWVHHRFRVHLPSQKHQRESSCRLRLAQS